MHRTHAHTHFSRTREHAHIDSLTFEVPHTYPLAEPHTGIDAKIVHKADVEQLNDKMGRLETDDLLNQITNQLTEKLRRTGKDMQELREDLDVILTMIMQDASVGAGMLKCLSCERPVCVRSSSYASSYCYSCALILLYMRPHTAK